MMKRIKAWGLFLLIISLSMSVGWYQNAHQENTAADIKQRSELSDGQLNDGQLDHGQFNDGQLNVKERHKPLDTLVLRSVERHQAGGEVRREAILMGSHFIFIVDAPQEQALDAIGYVSERIKKLEEKISSWKPSSDIARLNENAGIMPVIVDEETRNLLKLAISVSETTSGAFDITIAPVWRLWPFGKYNNASIPTDNDIALLLPLVDYKKIILDEERSTAYLPDKGMKVTLGAIGKGYAAEMAIDLMRKRGIERAAISAGGDIYLLGKKRTGPWVVDIEHPRWQGRSLARFVAGDIAIATSGDAKQFIVKSGKRYSHILDPRTGRPAQDCQSVTIASASASLADAYATAVFVMGPEEGIKWVNGQDRVEALIVDSNGVQHKSLGWEAITQQVKGA